MGSKADPQQKGVPIMTKPSFEVGDLVQISDGPFASVERHRRACDWLLYGFRPMLCNRNLFAEQLHCLVR